MADVGNLKVIISAVDKTSAGFKSASAGVTGFAKKNKAALVGAGAAITGLGVAGAFAIGKSIKKASEFEEVVAKFGTVFEAVSADAEMVADDISTNFGLSDLASKKLLSTTGDLLTGFGFTDKAALDMSEQVAKLAVDVASFSNIEGGAEVAVAALTKGLLGEREGLKTLGIAITEADLKQEALNQGMDPKILTRQQKATLTLQLAYKQSKKAVGDFERTQGSFANQTRIAQAAMEDMSAEIGSVFLPIATKIVSKVTAVVEWFTNLDEGTKKTIIIVAGIATGLALVIGPLLLLIAFLPALAGGFALVGTAITFMTGPIGLTILAVMALIAIFVLFKDEIISIIQGVGEVFKAGFGLISTILKGAFDVAKAIFGAWVGTFVFFWKSLFGIVKIIIGLIKYLGDRWKMGWIGLKIALAEVWNGIIGMVETGANKLISTLNKLISAMPAAIRPPSIEPIDLSKFEISTTAMKEEIQSLGAKGIGDYIAPGLDYMKEATAEYAEKLKNVSKATKAFSETSKTAMKEFGTTVKAIEWLPPPEAEAGVAPQAAPLPLPKFAEMAMGAPSQQTNNIQNSISIETLNVADEEQKKDFFEELQMKISGGVANTVTL